MGRHSKPTPPTPLDRVVRTVGQVVVALAVAVPATLKSLDSAGVHVESAPVVAAICGASVVFVTAFQNGLEQKLGKP